MRVGFALFLMERRKDQGAAYAPSCSDYVVTALVPRQRPLETASIFPS